MSESDVSSGSLGFARSYNSLSAQVGYSELVTGSSTGVMPLGLGWSMEHQQQIRISPSSSSTAWAIRPSGRVLTYQLSGTTWASDADVSDRLVELKNGSGVRTGWRYVDRGAERQETYDASGRLSEVRERDGRVVTVVYADGTDGGVSGNGGFVSDASGNPTTTVLPAGRMLRVQDSFGQKLVFGTDSSGRIVKITNSAGEAVRYGYDSANQLTTVTWPGGAVRTYHYNEAAHTGGANLPGALTGISDENGERYATYQYNASGRAIGEYLAGGADAANLSYTQDLYQNVTQTAYTDALGTTRTYGFATQFGVTRPTGVSQPGGPGCGASSSAITYDGNANVASRTDFAGSKTCYGNDLTRNLETVRVEGLGSADACPASPAGYSPTVTQRKTSTEWHPVWRLKVREAQPNRITTWVYHGQPDPTAGGAIASCAPSDAYVYDTEPIAVLCKQVEQATTDTTGGAGFGATASGAPRTWAYTWTHHGQMLTANGPRTDVADITTYEYYPDTTANWTKGDLKTLTNALGQVWSFTQYDAAGRLLSMTDPNGIVTTQTWHPRGWLTSRTTAGATESWSYYPTGLLQRQTLPDGRYYDYTWDDAHRLTDITDALGNRTHYTLDAAGNVTQVDVTDAGDQLARQQRTEYDALGRPWKRRDASGNVTEQRHDAMNRLNKLIDPKNRETDYQWDALGRLRQIDDAQQPVRGVTQAQYDGQDQLKSLTAPNGAHTQFTVNGLGDTTQELSPDRGTLTYTHDAAGNVTQRTDGVGRVTGYTWDALNRPLTLSYRPSAGGAVSETVTYTWDASAGCSHGIGRLCAVSDGAGSTTYSYNDKGHLVSATRVEAGQTHVTQYVRDLSGQVLSWVDPASSQFSAWRALDGQIRWQTVQRPGQSALSIADLLGYDAAGSLTDSVMGAQSGSSEWLGISRQYDADGRLADSLLAQISPSLSTNWTRIYAVPGESVEVSVTIGPVEARGTLVMCATSGPCAPQHVLGSLEIDAGGTYALQSLAALPLGIYNARVRFEPAPPFKSASDAGSRPVFIGVPPSQLIDDLLQ